MASFDDINGRYSTWYAQQQAAGLTSSQIAALPEFASFQSEITSAYSSTDDKDKLHSDIAWFQSNGGDAAFGSNYTKLATAAQQRLDQLNGLNFDWNAYWNKLLIPTGGNPSTPPGTDPTEPNVLADRKALDDRVTGLYSQLVSFQSDQSQFMQQLLVRQEEAAAQQVPHLPEPGGTVIRGGSAEQNRVGLDSLNTSQSGHDALLI